MLAELCDASSTLKSALDHYLSTSLAVRNEYEIGRALESHFDTVLDELEQLDSYELLIDQSRRVLGKFRNGRSTIVHINTLPPELLSRIFHLTIPTTCDHLWRNEPSVLLKHSLKSPESLLHVCSYWRSVALGSHELWTHIDLGPFTLLGSDLVRSGRLFLTHSGQLPLHIHINLDGSSATIQRKQDTLRLCASAAKRAKSLEFEYDCSFEEDAAIILEEFIANCTPGTLGRLVIESQYSNQQGFIVANDFTFEESDQDEFWTLDIPSSHFEGVLHGVTVLRLDGIYPQWTSQAYHGLVKLHLTDPSGLSISPSQLAGILAASPQLRFLYVGTAVDDDDDSEPTPVHLDDLEVLHLEFEEYQHDSVLRLILPGTKPIRMSTLVYNQNMSSDTLTGGEHKKFFARSNVTQFEAIWTAEGESVTLDFPKLLGLVPTLQVLELTSFDIELPSGSAASTRPPESQLAELRLVGSSIDPDAFQWVVNTYPGLEVYIEETSCWIPSEDRHYTRFDEWKDELVEIYPAVHLVEDAALAEEDWN